MKNITQLRKTFKKFSSLHKNVEVPAFLGNLAGTVKADVNQNVYVVLQNGEELTVRNVRVPNVPRLPVIIGYDTSNPTLLQVLRARDVYLNSPYPDIPQHADSTHQWPKHDTLFVRQEQFLPGLVIPTTGLSVQLMGFVYYLSGWHMLNNQEIDLTAQIPTTGAKYILVEVDDAGLITFSDGASADSRELLTYENIPAVSSVNKMPLFAVKVYVGQSSIIKSRLYTDIVDLRWSGYSNASGSAASLNWADIIDVPVVFPPDTDITDPLYVRKFDSLVDPTVNDDVSLGYLKNDLWHNTAARSYYLCHDNTDGAADWLSLGGGGGGGMAFVVDGNLAVLAGATNVIVFAQDTTIEEWYFHIEDKGSAGITTLDIHYFGGDSIFTTQANRPTIAFDAVTNLFVATPDVTVFPAGTVLELHIDEIATGAMSAVVVGAMASGGGGGGGGGAVTVTDGVSAPISVGNIIFDGATVTDLGGGSVTIVYPDPPAPDSGLLPLDVVPASPHAMDDEFTGSTLDAKWTDPTTSAAGNENTVAVSGGWLRISAVTANKHVNGIRQAAPSGSFSVSAKMLDSLYAGNDIRAGLFVGIDGGKGHVCGAFQQDGGIGAIGISTVSNTADWSGYDGFLATTAGNTSIPTWVRIRWNSATSTLYFDASQNGILWKNITSRSGMSQPDQAGLCIYSNSGAIQTAELLLYDWFRVVESADF